MQLVRTIYGSKFTNESQKTNRTFPRINVWQQYYATIIANLVTLTQGCVIGWLSPALPQLISQTAPALDEPLSSVEVSWLGSVSCLGATIGSLSFCCVVAQVGQKRSALFLSIPYISVWLFIYFGNTVAYILCARFIGGLAGGGADILILFISEISNKEIRGRLGTFPMFFRNLGTLLSYVLGAYVQYRALPCIYIVIPIVFAITFGLLPNTPRYHLQRGQFQKAESSLKFYMGYEGGPQEETAFYKEFERLKEITMEQKTKEGFAFSDICDRATLNGLGIGIALMACMSFTAVFAITSYAVITFQKAGTTFDPYTSSIILAVALVFGSLTSTTLADILGRRKLNLISLIGAAGGFAGAALYHYLNVNGYDLTRYAWIPVVCLCFEIFISTAGVISLASVCCVENLPPKIRTVGMAIIYAAFNLFQFISLKTYPILLDSVDLHGCLMVYGFGCVIGFVFVLFVLKETAGQSLDDIGVDVNSKTKIMTVNTNENPTNAHPVQHVAFDSYYAPKLSSGILIRC